MRSMRSMPGMRRKIGIFAAVAVGVASLLVATPVDAQIDDEMVWSYERPDGHPPVGVVEGHIQRDGRYMLFYRYDYTFFDGILAGEDSVSSFQVRDNFLFDELARTLKTRVHTVGFQLGVTDDLTVRASIPFVQKEMENWVNLTGDPSAFLVETFKTESGAFGDLRATALYEFVHEGPYRAHVHAGVSAPTGSVSQADDGDGFFPQDSILPYQMQTGSGTWDVLPGLTVLVQNDRASVGLQARGTLRLGDNDRGYTFGDRVDAGVWGAYRFNDYLSVSARLHAESWGEVDGVDPVLDPDANFTENPALQGGSRVDFPVGVNLYFPGEILHGHRLGLELALPIHQDLDGPQLRQDWMISVGWEKVY